MYIGVQASVETILGAIFETYIRWVQGCSKTCILLALCTDCRNGYIDGQDKKTNLRNIFDDSIIARILDYYGEVKDLDNNRKQSIIT